MDLFDIGLTIDNYEIFVLQGSYGGKMLVQRSDYTEANSNTNSRIEHRVKLKLSVSVRKVVDSTSPQHQVTTLNLSRQGLAIITNFNLDVGTEVEIFAFNDSFFGIATVCHITELSKGQVWVLGLKLIKKVGRWAIC
jgi:hypothetical protein